jgi:CubicO group peptidase (beta-lactamase class C family)
MAHCGFNAVRRDYARLGRLLAHDGEWEGKQIIPAQWMIDATTVRDSDTYLLPGRAMKKFGYGYLLWLFPGNRRQFALVGYKGQYICGHHMAVLRLATQPTKKPPAAIIRYRAGPSSLVGVRARPGCWPGGSHDLDPSSSQPAG